MTMGCMVRSEGGLDAERQARVDAKKEDEARDRRNFENLQRIRAEAFRAVSDYIALLCFMQYLASSRLLSSALSFWQPGTSPKGCRLATTCNCSSRAASATDWELGACSAGRLRVCQTVTLIPSLTLWMTASGR